MKKFRVVIAGGNLSMEMDGKVSKYGFYVPRFVKAIDKASAKSLALEEFKKSPKMAELSQILQNAAEDPPRIEIEEIEEVKEFEGIGDESGLILYPEDT